MSFLPQYEPDIKHWTDLWFGDNKQTGYVVTTNFKWQRSYGAKDVYTLIRDTEGIETRYMSLNGFAFGSRKSADLKQIRNIGVDIDQYKLGLSIDDALDEITSLIVSKVIPEPNLILTSRGIQLFYSIDKGAAPQMAWLTSYITEQFIGKMKKIGADGNAKDVSRLMRVPGSINERNNSLVKADIWNPYSYTLSELQTYCKPLEDFSTRKKKKAKVINFIPKDNEKKLSFFFNTNYKRLRDFDMLIELRKGDMTHQRNSFIYVYAFHQSLICSSLVDTEYLVYKVLDRIYSKADKPMSNAEFKRTVKSAYDDAKRFFEHYKTNNYQVSYSTNDGIIKPYKNTSLIDMFDITEDEQRALNSIMGSVVHKEKDANRKRKERRNKGMKTVEEYNNKRKNDRQAKLDQLKQLMIDKPKFSKAKMAKELGVHRSYLYQLLEEI